MVVCNMYIECIYLFRVSIRSYTIIVYNCFFNNIAESGNAGVKKTRMQLLILKNSVRRPLPSNLASGSTRANVARHEESTHEASF